MAAILSFGLLLLSIPSIPLKAQKITVKGRVLELAKNGG